MVEAVMIDYSLRADAVPEDVLFKAYVQSVIDRLTLVYDPAYSSTAVRPDAQYGWTDMHIIFNGWRWSYIPDCFRNGTNILDFARSCLPLAGQRKNAGYLPFLAYFSSFCLYDHGSIPMYEFPEGGTPVTMENTGTVSPARFPRFHGKDRYHGWSTASAVTEWSSRFPQGLPDGVVSPINLYGNPVHTYSGKQMCRCLDELMNMCTAILHLPYGGADHSWAFDGNLAWGDPYYYRRSQIYSTFRMREVRSDNGDETVKDSVNGDRDISAQIGWFEKVDQTRYKKTAYLTVTTRSESPFRYKFLILVMTYGNAASAQYFPYDFEWNKISVVYESPDWVSGDQTTDLVFDAGGDPGQNWSANIGTPAAVIYPDYPDRLNIN